MQAKHPCILKQFFSPLNRFCLISDLVEVQVINTSFSFPGRGRLQLSGSPAWVSSVQLVVGLSGQMARIKFWTTFSTRVNLALAIAFCRARAKQASFRFRELDVARAPGMLGMRSLPQETRKKRRNLIV